ncbi:DMT family transporter [Halococcus saccharolyticus]|uniref:DMT(Drug/metabolite transporter) superfamily permease n=1 Tax=Halococcus saccharolyticus DSM 5350 TaxID=1227455 RepID=M0MM03_9EURY|nr:DMT family transporter [Halococcus saccharolyticus]EMA46691.1 DMT(drug/metabolite transporter) superfamily permease [Halococcus saccharolyticus DSM 5350]
MASSTKTVETTTTTPRTGFRFQNVGLFLLMAIVLGGAFPAVKAGLEFLPPVLFAAFRFTLAGVLILGYAIVTSDRWRPRTRNDWTAVFAAGVFSMGGIGLAFIGQQFTTAGIAAIIFSLSPILTPIIAWPLLADERLSRRGIIGILVGFVGVGIVVQPNPAAFGSTLVGQSLILCATVSVTLGSVLIRRSGPTMSVVALTGWAMLIGATIQYGFSIALGESLSMVRLTPTAVVIVLYLAVVASGIGFVIYYVLLERFGPLEVNLVTYVIPVVATLVGWAVLGETITAAAVVGFLVIAAGFALLKYRELVAVIPHVRKAATR